MITAAKLDVYCQFSGDIDMWQRRGMPGPISGDDWMTIQNLLQELSMYKGKLVSQPYGDDILSRLAATTSDADTAARLVSMA